MPQALDQAERTPGFNPFRWFATGEDAPLIEEPRIIDRKFRVSRWSVLIATTLGYGFLYTCRLGLSVVKKPLIDNNIFDAEQLGRIGSSLLWGYAIGKLVNGLLADHANIRRFFAAGVFCSGVINIIMGGSPLLWVWMVLWGLNGWFQAFGASASVVSLSHWYRAKERGTVYGIWSMSHSIGEGLTFVVSATLVTHFGWRAGFVGPGLFCLCVAAGLFLSLRDRPETMGLPPVARWTPQGARVFPVVTSGEQPSAAQRRSPVSAGEEPHQGLSRMDILRSQAAILLRPSLWILGLSSLSMYVTRYAINNWGILYLQEAKGYSLTQAGAILGVTAVAGMAGSAAYGVISDFMFKARRPPVTLIFGLLEILALLVIFFSPPGHPWLLTGAFILFGFTLSGLVAVIGGLFAVDIAGKRAAGAALGFIGCFSYIGAGAQDMISGYLIKAGTTKLHDVNVYAFETPIAFWLGSSILSMVLAASLWNVKTRE